MLNNPHDSKRRPVDALFGDNAAQPLPNYSVEPPQPATTVEPPPLDSNIDSPAPATPPPMASLSMPNDSPSVPLPAAPSNIESTLPASARADDPRFLTLSFQIERLYDEVKSVLRDSPKLTNACFDLLLQARQAYERRDYAQTEFFVQSTDAKVKRSAKSAQASRAPIVFAIWAWEIVALLMGGGIIALSYVAGLTLFGLPVATEFIVLIRVLGWGMIGGVIGGMYNLPRYVQQRDYDPAYNMHYFARPIMGALIGALLFVISQAGILAGNIVVGDFKVGPIFLYVFALLAGFKQEYVAEFFDNLMRAIFRGQPK
jgi:hypothetical protein